MPVRATVDEVVERLARAPDPPLIAIDGLPCSGKSTLADTLRSIHGFDSVSLDDFVRPQIEWPLPAKPAFPFEYIRYAEFVHTVETLASTGHCVYAPFDWETLRVSPTSKTVSLAKPVIVEGVSTLNPLLVALYGLKIFVDSDRATTLETALKRGAGAWADPWRELFLPSVDIYMQTDPQQRADLIVPGRGAPALL